jgi:hypothetical protein
MELLARFFKSTKKQDPVEAAIAAVVALEMKKDKRTAALKELKEELQSKFEEAILSGADPGEQAALSAKIVAIQSELEAFGALITKARNEASKIIGAAKPQRVERIEELQKQIREIRAEKDRGRMLEVARFARRHGGTINFPTELNGGSLGLPAVVIPKEEIVALFDEVALEPVAGVDKRDTELAELNRELQRLNILERTGIAELAVSTLVEEAKKAA